MSNVKWRIIEKKQLEGLELVHDIICYDKIDEIAWICYKDNDIYKLLGPFRSVEDFNKFIEYYVKLYEEEPRKALEFNEFLDNIGNKLGPILKYKLIDVIRNTLSKILKPSRRYEIGPLELMEICVEKEIGVIGERLPIVLTDNPFETYKIYYGPEPIMGNKKKKIVWSVIPSHYIYFARTGEIILSDKELTLGIIHGFLEEVTPDKLVEIIKRAPHKNAIFKKIKKLIGIDIGENQIPYDIIVYEYTTLPDELVDTYIIHWDKIVDEILDKNVYSETIIDIYRPYTIEFPHIHYAPHGLISTSSGVGKSTLAEALGEKLDRVKPITLTGGMDPQSRRIKRGIVHGLHCLVQIESIEEKADKEDLLANALDLIQRGIASSGTGMRKVITRFYGAIVFTYNTTGEGQKEFVDMLLSMGKNVTAFGSRFGLLVFDSEIPPVKMRKINEDIMKLGNMLKLIRGSRKVRKIINKIYHEEETVKWFNTKPPEWEWINLDRIREISGYTIADKIRAFLTSYSKNGYVRAKGHAFASAISLHMKEIYRKNITLNELIKEADNIFHKTTFKLIMKAISNILELPKLFTIFELIEKETYYRKAFILGLYQYLNERDQYGIAGIVEVNHNELANYIRPVKKNSANRIIQLCMNNPGILRSLGIEFKKDIILVSPHQFIIDQDTLEKIEQQLYEQAK